uniref:MULE domain-containing protein n=1 Tax=Heterorhabditis bacteriophora TaxID=37862 RepID=A0A1I7XSF9_HETBA
MTVRVPNEAFIDDPENPQLIHYCQPKKGRHDMTPQAISGETSLLLFLNRIMQIPRKAHETGSPQLYTVMMEVNGGYCLPIFFAFIRDAKRTTYEDVFGFLGMLIESLRTQASLISPGMKFIANFEVQAMDAIKATLGVLVLGCHFYYAQCINRRANVLHFGKVRKELAAVEHPSRG